MYKILFLLVFTLSSGAVAKADLDYIMPYKHLLKLSEKNRNQYLKSLAKKMSHFEKENESLGFLHLLLGVQTAYAGSKYRCIGGGVPVAADASSCGASEYAGFKCQGADQGKEICNPLIFGVNADGSPQCFTNATTRKCYKRTVTGQTHFFSNEKFNSPEVKQAYQDFKETIDGICNNRIEVQELPRYKEEACSLVRKQMQVNLTRGLKMERASTQAAVATTNSASSEFSAAWGGGSDLFKGAGFSMGEPVDTYSELGSNQVGMLSLALNDCEESYKQLNINLPISYFRENSKLNCDKVNKFISLYNKFKNQAGVSTSRTALQRSLAFFVKHKDGSPAACGGSRRSHRPLANQEWITMIDYTKSYRERRAFFLNTKTGQVTPSTISHGRGSEGGCYGTRYWDRREGRCKIPYRMTNVDDDFTTPGGFLRVSEENTASEFGSALRLDGINSYNDNSRSRTIVMHPADYVSNSRAGRSLGCPSLTSSMYYRMHDNIKNGSLMYMHTIDEEKKSQPEC